MACRILKTDLRKKKKKKFQPDSQGNLSFEVIWISDSFYSRHSLPSAQNPKWTSSSPSSGDDD